MAAKKFEVSLKKLEDIVKKLEEGDLALDESLKIFEEGIKLSRLCTKQLEEAERKIEILVKSEGETIETKPFLE
jgi:exodeoxyribonuclease VII small subunit